LLHYLCSALLDGLRKSRFGVVVLSPTFFVKAWPRRELNTLLQKEATGAGRVLPVLHDLTPEELRAQDVILADRLCLPWTAGAEFISAEIARVVTGES
jgi:hypothetical protein